MPLAGQNLTPNQHCRAVAELLVVPENLFFCSFSFWYESNCWRNPGPPAAPLQPFTAHMEAAWSFPRPHPHLPASPSPSSAIAGFNISKAAHGEPVSDTHIPALSSSDPSVPPPQKKPYGGVSPRCGKQLVAVAPDGAGEVAVMGSPSL